MSLPKAEVVVDVWGLFAMFTRPESKVERNTYDVITPSAARGVLSAIYCKPVEFHYEITKIEVMKPIRTIRIKKNETVKVASDRIEDDDYCIDMDNARTQRISTYLTDVYYRIHANICMEDSKELEPRVTIESLVKQFNHRVSHGKCFYQPALGTRECLCHFSLPDENMKPIEQSKDLGIMLYDVFDITDKRPLDTRRKTYSNPTMVTVFNAVMKNGVIEIPEWEDKRLLRKENL